MLLVLELYGLSSIASLLFFPETPRYLRARGYDEGVQLLLVDLMGLYYAPPSSDNGLSSSAVAGVHKQCNFQFICLIQK